ncbi:MAG TPA: dienelactone hydrolase family protein [Acidimicrobiales bacterium]|jgi:carboxymethylenebutenolidase|nr:dienelactone hydrolase family protein [Acidimicrobiales bacterium]
MQTRTETITAPDGMTFTGHVAVPASGRGPGLLVLQEIFGVNEYIRDVCRRLAELGYVAMAPDVFFRIEPGVDLAHDESSMKAAFGYIGQYDWSTGTGDLVAALAHLRTLPEAGGRAGAIGFCMGGTTSFALACAADPDVVVSYYGSGVADMLEGAGGVTAPVQFHFGGNDPYIPGEAIARVAAWSAERDHVEFHVYESGHAFDNNFSAMFSDPAAAEAAWANTTRFLAQHLPA